MNGHSITIGTYFGILVRIHYSWLVIFILIAWSVVEGILPSYFPYLGLTSRLFAGLTITILFFVSVLCHEFAHALVARRHGVRVKRVTLFLLGGAAELPQEPSSAKTELLMTIAGPLVSLAIGALSGVLWAIGRLYHIDIIVILAGPLAILNLSVGLFNLLPGYPLDGGRIFRALIWMHTNDIVQATKTAAYVSYALAYLLIAYGLIAIFGGAVVGGFWFGLLGFFLFQAAQASLTQTTTQERLKSVRVRDVMDRNPHYIPAPLSVEAFVSEYVLRYGHYDYLVVREDEAVGIIEFLRITHRPDVAWDEPVTTYMVPLANTMRLKPSQPASKALRIMRQHNLPILPVYEYKQLVGAVSAQRISDYILVGNVHTAIAGEPTIAIDPGHPLEDPKAAEVSNHVITLERAEK